MLIAASQAFAQTANTETIKLFYRAFGQNQPELLDKVLAPSGRTSRQIKAKTWAVTRSNPL